MRWREWLGARTGTRYGLVLLAPVPIVYLVFALLWTGQHLLQSDLTGYYTAATIVTRGQGSLLYDLDLQRQVQGEIIYPHRFEVGGLLPFQYPPFAVLPFLPLTSLSIGEAYYLWAFANLVAFVVALAVLSTSAHRLGERPRVQALLWVASLAFLPFLSALLLGQLSFLVLLVYAVGFHLLLRGRDTAAGFILAGAAVKPHLLLVLPLLLLAKGRWRALAGLIGGLAALSVLAWLVVGPLDVAQFIEANRETSGWLPLSFNLAWLGFFSSLLEPWPSTILAATLIADGLSLLLLWMAWRGPWRPESHIFGLRLSLLLIVSMAVAPHLYPHDLVLLVPVAFYVADYLVGVKGGGRGLATAKILGALVFVAGLVDGYPLLDLPARPVFLAMVAAGIAIFVAIRRSEHQVCRSQCGEGVHSPPPGA